MLPRWIWLGVLLQLAVSASPSPAFVLCVSADGCTAVEVAAPGTVHCYERQCDEQHRGTGIEDDAHSCRDVPLLSAAAGPTQPTTRADVQPAPVSGLVVRLLVPIDGRLITVRDRGPVAPAAAPSLRATVLVL